MNIRVWCFHGPQRACQGENGQNKHIYSERSKINYSNKIANTFHTFIKALTLCKYGFNSSGKGFYPTLETNKNFNPELKWRVAFQLWMKKF